MIKTYMVVAKKDEKSLEIEKYLINNLDSILEYDSSSPDLIITIGGDGTMLYAMHKYFCFIEKSFFIGIHTGTLGFYTDYLSNEVDCLIDGIKSGSFSYYYRNILETKMYFENGYNTYYALNEMRIENPHFTQLLDIYINDELMEVFRGNGICVSTASGSTAYNKSLGGAVLHPDLEVMQLTEIAGIQHNAYRSLGSSLVLGKNHLISFKPHKIKGAFIGIDQESYPLDDVTKIDVMLSNHRMKCIQYHPLTFISRIRRTFIQE